MTHFAAGANRNLQVQRGFAFSLEAKLPQRHPGSYGRHTHCHDGNTLWPWRAAAPRNRPRSAHVLARYFGVPVNRHSH